MQLKGFTLIEIIIVVVLIGVIATFAIPNYTKSVDRAYVKDMNVSLSAIYAAQKIYFNSFGTYKTTADLAAVNNDLSLGIANTVGTAYDCVGGATFTCNAVRTLGATPGPASTYTVTQASSVPTCAGYCP